MAIENGAGRVAVDYSEAVADFSSTCWILPAASLGGIPFGIFYLFEAKQTYFGNCDMDTNAANCLAGDVGLGGVNKPLGAAFGIFGTMLVAGAVTGVAIGSKMCADQSAAEGSVLRVQPRSVRLIAAHDGFEDQLVELRVPSDLTNIDIDLRPNAGTRTSSSSDGQPQR